MFQKQTIWILISNMIKILEILNKMIDQENQNQLKQEKILGENKNWTPKKHKEAAAAVAFLVVQPKTKEVDIKISKNQEETVKSYQLLKRNNKKLK